MSSIPTFDLMPTPPDPTLEQQQARLRAEAKKELASRELARRTFRHYIQRMMPEYVFDWVHEVAIEELQKFWEAVERKESPRLAIFMPPRVGKSQLSSIFLPSWALGRSPRKELVITAYAANLADEFSKKTREILREPDYQLIFPDTRLHKDMASVDSWRTTQMGGYTSVGVGGGLTGKGADCLVYETEIITDKGVKTIGEMVETLDQSRVLSYNHSVSQYEWKRIVAHQAKEAEYVYEVQSIDGKSFRATADHRVYVVGRGYVPVSQLRVGDALIGAAGAEVLSAGEANMHTMRDGLYTSGIRGSQSLTEEREGPLLLERMFAEASCDEEQAQVRALWKTDTGEDTALLLGRVQARIPHKTPHTGEGVPSVWDALPPETQRVCNVQQGLRGTDALPCDAWGGELELQNWNLGGIQYKVQTTPRTDMGTGRTQVRELRSGEGYGCAEAMRSPHRPRQGERCTGESDNFVSELPCIAPSTCTVAAVTRVSETGHRVYDIQVEGNHNFFANGILVHNCIILDDLYKDRADADSESYRRTVEDWFKSTAYTRIQPGGGCLILFTRWHSLDLGGFIDEHMQHENFKILRFAALAEHDEEHRKEGESINPQRRSAEDYLRIKKTVGVREWQCLYQQDPVPADGTMFKLSDVRYYDKDIELETADVKRLPDEQDLTFFTAWDFSTGRGTDFTVGVVAAVDRDYNLYVIDVKRGKWEAFDIAEKIIDTAVEYKTQRNGMEQGQLSAMIEPILDKRMSERKQFINKTPLKPGRQNKVARSMTIHARMQQGKVFFPKNAHWLQDFLAELLAFPVGKNDDQVDGFSYCGLMINDISPPMKAKMKPKKSWKDRLKSLNTGNNGPTWMSS